MHVDHQLRTLLRVYGPHFLAYVLNLDPSTFTDSAANEGVIDDIRMSLVDNLYQLETTIQDGLDSSNSQRRIHFLALHNPALGGTVCASFRRQCGGRLDVPAADDEVERLLLHLCAASYPLRVYGDWDAGTPTPHLPLHDPVNQQFQAAVQADTVLSTLFSGSDQSNGCRRNALRSTGYWGSVHLWSLADHLLTSAWYRAHLVARWPTMGDYFKATAKALGTLRAALSGQRTQVPMRIGLAGVLLSNDVDFFDIGWARIRRTDDRDTYLAQRIPFAGPLNYRNSSGETIFADFGGNLVLETAIDYMIAFESEDDETHVWPDELSQPRSIGRSIETLRLALLLAGIENLPMVIPVWQTVDDPLGGSDSFSSVDVTNTAKLRPTLLTGDHVRQWQEWVATVEQSRTPQIDIAVRRLLRAATERKESEDTLIDAVIVWENLFGAAQETTLRITHSIAWLLGDGPAERGRIVQETKHIHNQRSKIVHGAAKVDKSKTPPAAERAIAIAVDLLRAMFLQRPELLQLSSSELRSKSVLLAGDMPPDP